MFRRGLPSRQACAAIVLALCLPAAASGQTSPLAVVPTAIGPPPPVPPEVVSRDSEGRTTIRSTPLPGPIVIDGKLDEPMYQSVLAVGGFIQQEPRAGEPATEKTDAWIFHDDRNLYISARCWDSHQEKWVLGDMRHDGQSFTSVESIMVALDTFYDRRNGFNFAVNTLGGVTEGQVTNERDVNRDWNTVWDSRVARFPGGWTLEMQIPFKSLRYPPGAQIWGIQFRRVARWKNELSYFTPVPPSAGALGIFKFSVAATLVGIDLPPTGRNVEVKPYALSGVRTDLKAKPPASNDFGRDAGVDVKYGVARGLTADFTYRTDFAQVEDDTQQVNLTRFNLFYPEKREFFLEGQGSFGIGGTPTTPGDIPVIFFSRRIGLEGGRPVPIEAGARLTGKAGLYTVGLINVQTGDEPVSGARATNFTVARVKRDFLRRSTIGAMLTRRSASTVGPGANEAYAVDGVFSFFQNLNVNTYLARTRTPGLTGDATSYRAQLDYKADRYGVQLERMKVGAHFNPEVGFLRRVDFQRNFGLLRFSPRPRSVPSVRRFSYEATFDEFTNGIGRVVSRTVEGAYRVELQNGDKLSVEFDRNYELIKRPFNVASNVTIPVGGYFFQEFHLTYTADVEWKMSGTLNYEQGGFYGGNRNTLSYTGGRVVVTPQIWLYPGVSINWVDVPQGRFSSRVASLRGIYTLTPRLFVAAFGQYSSDTHAVSTNLRLRWEYRPSSELFIVYNEGRTTLPPARLGLNSRALVVKITRLFRL